MKKSKAFQKSYMEIGCQVLLRAGMMLASVLTERSKLRRQMAAAAGQKSTTSLSLFLEACGLEVEEELSTMATQYWAEGAWTGMENGTTNKKKRG